MTSRRIASYMPLFIHQLRCCRSAGVEQSAVAIAQSLQDISSGQFKFTATENISHW